MFPIHFTIPVSDMMMKIIRKRTSLPEGDRVLFYHLYPGLKDENYSFNKTSMAVVLFDTEFDLDSLANNDAGISPEGDIIDKLLPQCTWISEIFNLLIQMTKEQVEEERWVVGGISRLM